ncbi:hypothetical protein DID99_34325 [Burkholderia sp. Bp8986]|nr:hypothetical protein DID99_34325 [Burkholderia sp. Bp8986]
MQFVNRRNRVDQRQQLGDTIDIRAGQDRGEWHVVCVGYDMALETRTCDREGLAQLFCPALTARNDDESAGGSINIHTSSPMISLLIFPISVIPWPHG